MVLIGIVANKKSFELIKTEILKREKQINVIHITPLSLENMKNIKFETVIIEENLEKTLANLMKKTSAELFIRNIMKVFIVASDFGEKIYWIDYELSKPVYKPNSSIDLKQFYNLRNIF